MSPADKRIAELLDRWMASVETHARYLRLDDAAYAKAQNWPAHQRPTKWVVELAQARLRELKRIHADREARGDAGFAEALELMSFLTTLLGSEHIERFIPLAVPGPAAGAAPARKSDPMRGAARPARKPAAAPAAIAPAAARAPGPDKVAATVIADAVRFLGWGREWPQLASLIARLADRPPEPEIWKILRAHRAEIEAQSRRPRD